MIIRKQFSFNDGEEMLKQHKSGILDEVHCIIESVDVSDCRNKKSKEKTKKDEFLYSPVEMNKKFKNSFQVKGWNTGRRIKCQYQNLGTAPEEVINTVSKLRSDLTLEYRSKSEMKKLIRESVQQISSKLFRTVSADKLIKTLVADNFILSESKTRHILSHELSEEELIEYVTPDFTGFREMDAVKDDVGVEVQFGKYAFMVYNVCAKMTIFKKHGFINYGIEIVPVKSLQRDMSTGVAFFEQFVWDLEERGVSNIDIPVLIIGIDVE